MSTTHNTNYIKYFYFLPLNIYNPHKQYHYVSRYGSR